MKIFMLSLVFCSLIEATTEADTLIKEELTYRKVDDNRTTFCSSSEWNQGFDSGIDFLKWESLFDKHDRQEDGELKDAATGENEYQTFLFEQTQNYKEILDEIINEIGEESFVTDDPQIINWRLFDIKNDVDVSERDGSILINSDVTTCRGLDSETSKALTSFKKCLNTEEETLSRLNEDLSLRDCIEDLIESRIYNVELKEYVRSKANH